MRMARPWRIQFPGAIYHLSGRGNNRGDIFLDDADRQTFLELLGQAVPRFSLQLFAFCLMTNHYHLFLRTRRANLSQAMHWLNAAYTQRFHRQHRRSGHLLQGRYKSVLIADEAHWLHLSMYLHLNPVRAGLVEDPADYPWSSFRDYTQARRRYAWLAPEEILANYGFTPAGRRRRYRQECLGLAGSKPSFWQEFRSRAVLGSREAVEELARKYRPAGQVEEVPEYTKSQVRTPVETALTQVAQNFRTTVEDLKRRRRGDLARQVAYWHLVRHCGLPVNRVAEIFGVGHSAVSMGLRKIEKQKARDRSLAASLQALIDY